MRLTMFFAPKGYEKALAPAIVAGAAVHGDEIVLKSTEEYRGPEGDAGLIIGVVKRDILWDHAERGVPLVYVDKGFKRTRALWHGVSLPGYWRMCWNATHPTAYLMELNARPDRWKALGLKLRERQPDGQHIVILGSSAKFHHTEQIAHPTEWTRTVVASTLEYSQRPIWYRPKPSWADAEPVDGTTFDHGHKSDVAEVLKDAWCSITYGSIASVDSICAGVPCIVLGNAVAGPICARAISRVERPLWETAARREQWAANLAYCQFTPAEIAAGVAWKIVKEHLRYAI